MTTKKLVVTGVAMTALIAGSIGAALTAVAATPNWNATGSYVVAMNYLGTDYPHDMVLVQDSSGNLTGNGGSPAGANVYTWVITSGSVNGDTIDFLANYTATADAVTPQTVLHVVGTIAPNGTMSGTWSDNYQGGVRTGTWASTSGASVALHIITASAGANGTITPSGSVSVVNGANQTFTFTPDTGFVVGTIVVDGSLVADAASYTFTNVTTTHTISVTFEATPPIDTTPNSFTFVDQANVALSALITSNTITVAGINATTSISVSGGAYSLNGGAYTTATGMVGNGDTVAVEHTSSAANSTATNTTLTIGGISDTFTSTTLAATVGTAPTDMGQCKNDGWKTFTNPSFKNQGQCVAFVEHLSHGHGE